ncbi:MAG: hypothetical protein JWN37_300 [Candidatus Nomurabacteria bacterium]|nr:hypothetical protein [Candidatus Nomurabacteria bacterium]
MKKALISLSILSAGITSVFAQVINGQVNGTPLLNLLGLAQTIVNRLVPFAIGVAILALFYFLIMFIFKNDDATKHAANLKGMGLAVLAIFVMVSIWGIVGLVGNISGIGQGGQVPIPGVPSPCPVGMTTC